MECIRIQLVYECVRFIFNCHLNLFLFLWINIYSIAWINTTIIVSPMIKLSEYKQRARTHTPTSSMLVFRFAQCILNWNLIRNPKIRSYRSQFWVECVKHGRCTLFVVCSDSTQTHRWWLFALIMIFFLRSIWAIVHAYKIIACNTVYVYGLRTVHMYSGRVLSIQWLATIFKTTDKLIANCPHALMCECLSKSQKIKTKLNDFSFK